MLRRGRGGGLSRGGAVKPKVGSAFILPIHQHTYTYTHTVALRFTWCFCVSRCARARNTQTKGNQIPLDRREETVKTRRQWLWEFGFLHHKKSSEQQPLTTLTRRVLKTDRLTFVDLFHSLCREFPPRHHDAWHPGQAPRHRGRLPGLNRTSLCLKYLNVTMLEKTEN